MLTIIRRLEFDAGHRVMNHESKCATLHGHRYVIEIEASAKDLDSIGRIIDFSVLKEKIGTWLDENWDHNLILFKDDIETVTAAKSIPRKKEPFICEWNPTAENLASFLLKEVCPHLMQGTDIFITAVTVHETPNCKAVARL